MAEKEAKQISTFAVLKNIDVSKQKSKKMGLDYLSWAYAWNFMKDFDKDATVEYTQFQQVNPQTFLPLPESDQVPYCVTPQGTYVEATVTIKNHAEKQMLPVMDYKNKAVKNPDLMQINKALQRAFVKALALHGLGLNLYAGEDLPNENDVSNKQSQRKSSQTNNLKKTSAKPKPDDPATANQKDLVKKVAEEYAKLTGTETKAMLDMVLDKNKIDPKIMTVSQAKTMYEEFEKYIATEESKASSQTNQTENGVQN